MQNKSDNNIEKTDLLVIGAGMSGMAASLFAANRNIKTIQVGKTGGLLFSSSMIDLLGVHPISEKKTWNNPWDGIDKLIEDIPKHPYAKIEKNEIQNAIEEILKFFNEANYPYNYNKNKNQNVITAQGTIRNTYCVPESMWSGVLAFERKDPSLIIDFNGLKEFSARQISETLNTSWPGLRIMRLNFPDSDKQTEIFSGHLAQALDSYDAVDIIAEEIKPNVKGAKTVGFPAILGIKNTMKIINILEEKIGVPVFEIPTMPTSVPGLRLKEIFDSNLVKKGVKKYSQQTVNNVKKLQNGNFLATIENKYNSKQIEAKGVILASGRFMGKGLTAERTTVKESIFNLPVSQPESRKDWHSINFYDQAGHPINRAGLEVDRYFRPTNQQGQPVYENLYAAGSILAHQDWMRMKCGSGMSIATAYAAVNSFLNNLNLSNSTHTED